MLRNDNLSKVIVSRYDEAYKPDVAAKGALSRWLEDDNIRMRIISYPKDFIADHICYKGHAIYVTSGDIKVKIDEDTAKWTKGDAFIIPDGIPHEVINDSREEAILVVMDANLN